MKQIISIEEALQKVGNKGKYQTIFMFIFFTQWFVSIFIFLGPTFFFPEPEFICENNQQCTENSGGCVLQILKNSDYNTITKDFKLYCENRNLRNIAQSAIFWGPIIGNILFSFLADWKGRKFALLLAWTISTLGIIGISFSYNPYQLIVMYLLTGFALVPCNNLNLVIVNEQSGESFREKASTFLLMSWAIFELCLVGVCYLIKSWRNIFIYVICIPSIIVSFLNFYLVESPRFLLAKKKEKVFGALNVIASRNGKENLSEEQYSLKDHEYIEKTRIYTYWDLFKFKSLRNQTFASCLVMFSAQMIYYSTQFSLSSLGNNVYTNSLIVGGGELFSYLMCNLFVSKLKRKLFTFIFFFIIIILSLILYFFDQNSPFSVAFALFIRICNCFNMGILAVFVEELYPTTVRSLGVGIQMSIGVAGSSLAPYVIDLAEKWGKQSLFLTGLLNIPTVFIIALFRETKGEKLHNDILELVIDNQQITYEDRTEENLIQK